LAVSRTGSGVLGLAIATTSLIPVFWSWQMRTWRACCVVSPSPMFRPKQRLPNPRDETASRYQNGLEARKRTLGFLSFCLLQVWPLFVLCTSVHLYFYCLFVLLRFISSISHYCLWSVCASTAYFVPLLSNCASTVYLYHYCLLVLLRPICIAVGHLCYTAWLFALLFRQPANTTVLSRYCRHVMEYISGSSGF